MDTDRESNNTGAKMLQPLRDMCVWVSVYVLYRDVAVGEVIMLRFPQIKKKQNMFLFFQNYFFFLSC